MSRVSQKLLTSEELAPFLPIVYRAIKKWSPWLETKRLDPEYIHSLVLGDIASYGRGYFPEKGSMENYVGRIVQNCAARAVAERKRVLESIPDRTPSMKESPFELFLKKEMQRSVYAWFNRGLATLNDKEKLFLQNVLNKIPQNEAYEMIFGAPKNPKWSNVYGSRLMAKIRRKIEKANEGKIDGGIVNSLLESVRTSRRARASRRSRRRVKG